MKKILLQLDTDLRPSAFDGIVAYDSGIDQLMPFASMSSENVESTVHGAIFTRGAKHKRYTAIFIGGSNLREGEVLFEAVQKLFFGNFRVSVMLDSNGCNTTAAAAVASITSQGRIAGKKAVVLAGTGPLGQRASVLLAQEGADIILTSRRQERADAACTDMKRRFGVSMVGQQVTDAEATAAVLEGAQIVLATGTPGIELLPANIWQTHPTLEIVADVNTVPPSGIEGLKMTDKVTERHGKICFGGLGIGGLKMKVHRTAIGQLFETNDQIFDVEAIYELAKSLV